MKSIGYCNYDAKQPQTIFKVAHSIANTLYIEAKVDQKFAFSIDSEDV